MKKENKQLFRLIILEVFVWASILAILFFFDLVLVPWGITATGITKLKIDAIRFLIAGITIILWLSIWYYLMHLILTMGLKERQHTL